MIKIEQLVPIISVVIGLIGLFIAYKGLLQGKKSLSYEIDTQADVITVDQTIYDKVQILFEGKPVERVSLVAITITNDGEKTKERHQQFSSCFSQEEINTERVYCFANCNSYNNTFSIRPHSC